MPRSHVFSRAWPRLHVFALNSDWFIVLFARVVIGQSNFSGLVLRQSIENRSKGINVYAVILFQARFMKLMNEKASLIERIQELEHITIQLSMETETIGKKELLQGALVFIKLDKCENIDRNLFRMF